MAFQNWRIFVLLSCMLTSCVHSPPSDSNPDAVPGIPDREYYELIKSQTAFDRRYDGFFEVYELHALMMNSEIQNMILQRQGHFMQWDQARLREEKERISQTMSNQTRVVMSFFTPDFQYDDLAKSNSVWRVFLESKGKRYEGKVKKITTKLAELRDLFPFHNRFSTAYEITFPVSGLAVEQGPASLTITSTLGTSILKLKPASH